MQSFRKHSPASTTLNATAFSFALSIPGTVRSIASWKSWWHCCVVPETLVGGLVIEQAVMKASSVMRTQTLHFKRLPRSSVAAQRKSSAAAPDETSVLQFLVAYKCRIADTTQRRRRCRRQRVLGRLDKWRTLFSSNRPLSFALAFEFKEHTNKRLKVTDPVSILSFYAIPIEDSISRTTNREMYVVFAIGNFKTFPMFLRNRYPL